MRGHWLYRRLAGRGASPALIRDGRRRSFDDLLSEVDRWADALDRVGAAGDVVAFPADGDCTALLLGCLLSGRVAAPSPPEPDGNSTHLADVFADLQVTELVPSAGAITRLVPPERPAILASHRAAGRGGLAILTSGSSGRPKVILLDGDRWLSRFEPHRAALCTLAFLRLDHSGGLDALLTSLSSGGTIVYGRSTDPDEVCATMAREHVQLLPTSPTFLRLLLISGAHERHDLGALQVIAYGTEPMSERLLREVQAALPRVTLKQTYGLSELGTFRTRALDSTSTWVKLGGEGCEFRIVDGTLRIRTPRAMLGYLGAPSPFDPDGWFDTGDLVDVDGEYVRIRGRASDMINVGGEKVSPLQVEDVIAEVPGVREVAVYGKRNPVTGMVVAASVTLLTPADSEDIVTRIAAHCRARLAPAQVPMSVRIESGTLHSRRFKTQRRAVDE
jgi:long-chain acyl-CoA synthetase